MQSISKLIPRYSETDQMGIIHHSNYAVWFEVARLDYLKELGISNKNIEEKGVLLPLCGMNCQFKSPARCEEEVVIKARITELSCVRLNFSYEVLDGLTNRIIAYGETMHAWTSKKLKPINAKKRIPDVYHIILKSIDENEN